MKEGRFCFQVPCLERNGLRSDDSGLPLAMNRLPKGSKTEETFNTSFQTFPQNNKNHEEKILTISLVTMSNRLDRLFLRLELVWRMKYF